MTTFIVSSDFTLPCVVLGGGDPEMHAIELALKTLGVPYCYALAVGADGVVDRVKGPTAYKATLTGFVDDGVISLQGTREDALWVECGHIHTPRVNVADHHNPGDRGYGRSPQDYWEASSIGQVYLFLLEWSAARHSLGWTAEVLDAAFGAERFLIAAGDHCPAHAFAGMCPGIDIGALKEMRARNSAAFNKQSPEEWLAVVDAAIARLMQLPVATAGGFEYRVSTEDIPLLNHAQLIAATPVQYVMQGTPRDPRTKVGLLGGIEPALVAGWMENMVGTLVDIYGDPSRGYAGGYIPS